MKTLNIGKHRVVYYDNIEELPIVRFHKWQKLLLIDSGVGSDLSSFDQHLEKARRYCKLGKTDLAEAELMNLRQCVWFIQEEFSPAHLAFSALVTEVDGKPCTEISDDALSEVAKMFADIPKKELTAEMQSVKKKIDAELMTYFPRLFGDSDVKEYFDLLRKKAILNLQSILKGEVSDSTESEKLEDAIILYANPRCYNGKDSVEIAHDKNFENLCLILSQKLNLNGKGKSVLEFYNAFEFLRDSAQKEQAQNKANKRR